MLPDLIREERDEREHKPLRAPDRKPYDRGVDQGKNGVPPVRIARTVQLDAKEQQQPAGGMSDATQSEAKGRRLRR